MIHHSKKRIFWMVSVLALALPFFASATVGVGIGTGKISMDQKLKPGLIYTLPPLVVINTGDEPMEYGLSIIYREKQPEIKPGKEWFTFIPNEFHLEKGESQLVEIKLTLPVKDVLPGDYFAFLQAHPVSKDPAKGTTIGIAAAAKLYFSVEPSNIFMAIYYRTVALFEIYAPWSYVALSVFLAVVFISILRRFFSFNFGVKLKKK